jgi:hypothetical protein
MLPVVRPRVLGLSRIVIDVGMYVTEQLCCTHALRLHEAGALHKPAKKVDQVGQLFCFRFISSGSSVSESDGVD